MSNEEAALLSDGAALALPAVSSTAFPGAGDVFFMELFMHPVNLSAWRHALTHCPCLESWMGTH